MHLPQFTDWNGTSDVVNEIEIIHRMKPYNAICIHMYTVHVCEHPGIKRASFAFVPPEWLCRTKRTTCAVVSIKMPECKPIIVCTRYIMDSPKLASYYTRPYKPRNTFIRHIMDLIKLVRNRRGPQRSTGTSPLTSSPGDALVTGSSSPPSPRDQHQPTSNLTETVVPYLACFAQSTVYYFLVWSVSWPRRCTLLTCPIVVHSPLLTYRARGTKLRRYEIRTVCNLLS